MPILFAASHRSLGPPELQRPYRLTPLSLTSSMVIKPECPPAPARNSGRHKPSEAPPRCTTEKRHDTQLYDTLTELRDSIPPMRVETEKEGEESATKDPQEGTPKTMVDEVAIICMAREYIALLEERNRSLVEDHTVLQSTIAALEMLFSRY
ncbi:Hypothetical protein NCS54_01482100 [Fusarium falciforme]|uniref:Hypothetical protein n=1 Tax=Fusarium falciforme TaxID=195108 RepID=UPI002300E960|nr:Hypothetical protein NCS54_01482100 [Fusarium falciforme]WAO97112.1 Hypothetical protein NCS54_01482100 [Fusarium falciforme]